MIQASFIFGFNFILLTSLQIRSNREKSPYKQINITEYKQNKGSPVNFERTTHSKASFSMVVIIKIRKNEIVLLKQVDNYFIF